MRHVKATLVCETVLEAPAVNTTWSVLALTPTLLVTGCEGCRSSRTGNPPPASQTVIVRDAGADVTRVRLPVAEAAPLGPSADRREVDVPLAWIYLLSDPAPTGSAPYAVLGARLPCGYGVLYGTSDKVDREVRLRLRARYRGEGPVPAVIPPCGDRPMSVHLVSLSILRLGDWRVVDAVPHGPGDDPVPVARVQHVVADDTSLAPAAVRWTRACATDADCASGGGECVRVEGVGVCQPPIDGWLGAGQGCPGGTLGADLHHGTAARRGCIAACEDGGVCPGSLRCVSGRWCLPQSVR